MPRVERALLIMHTENECGCRTDTRTTFGQISDTHMSTAAQLLF